MLVEPGTISRRSWGIAVIGLLLSLVNGPAQADVAIETPGNGGRGHARATSYTARDREARCALSIAPDSAREAESKASGAECGWLGSTRHGGRAGEVGRLRGTAGDLSLDLEKEGYL